jgi:hypothetical protein
VTTYDPDTPPSPSDWLGLDESLRLLLVTDYHKGSDLRDSRLRLHAAIHVVVENQIALGEEVVLDALARLQREGLSRHDAIHAIGTAVSDHLFEILKTDADDERKQPATYVDRVKQLTAESWRKSGA